MMVGTLVRKTSNGLLGVVVKTSNLGYDTWCEVLYHNETIVGCWHCELEVV